MTSADTGDKVREVVANGADRVAFHGEAADVPLDSPVHRSHPAQAGGDRRGHRPALSEAERYHFASVCINPTWVKRAANNLRGTGCPCAL
jgi:hypothetical protein